MEPLVIRRRRALRLPPSGRCWPLGVLLFWLVSVWSRVAIGQSFDLQDPGWEGVKGLVDLARQELGEARVVAANRIDWTSLTPADGLLILHPEGTLDSEELAAFLRAGGRGAIVDDFGVGDQVLARYQIRRVPAPRKPLFALRGNPALALAEPVHEVVAGRRGGVHPVVAEVDRLVTNHPTGLLHPDLSTVLKIRAAGETDCALAVAGQVGKGRLFAMGDPSALINLMLRYRGNRAFAVGLVRYLVDDDSWGIRQGKLVIVSNRFSESGVYGADSTAAREVREWFRSARSEVQRISVEGLPRGVSFALAVACVTGLVLWGSLVSGRVYRPPTPRFARGLPLVGQGGVAGRAAVLAAEGTHRGLVLLEQKDAFIERLGALLGMDRPPHLSVAVEELARRQWIDGAALLELKKMVVEMTRVEIAVSSGQPVRVTRQTLERVERIVEMVLKSVEEQRYSREVMS
ncbi:MAG: DUF4350 domain-containing protein [Myxococcales bacterium]|nr:DUF4350 domain-containing protein [Polyangiaceae bacterium]MDW8247676.1 DUF4350 domain-containing protein [Myxococcales bacterium]